VVPSSSPAHSAGRLHSPPEMRQLADKPIFDTFSESPQVPELPEVVQAIVSKFVEDDLVSDQVQPQVQPQAVEIDLGLPSSHDAMELSSQKANLHPILVIHQYH
jgi:hypothetical protein